MTDYILYYDDCELDLETILVSNGMDSFEFSTTTFPQNITSNFKLGGITFLTMTRHTERNSSTFIGDFRIEKIPMSDVEAKVLEIGGKGTFKAESDFYHFHLEGGSITIDVVCKSFEQS